MASLFLSHLPDNQELCTPNDSWTINNQRNPWFFMKVSNLSPDKLMEEKTLKDHKHLPANEKTWLQSSDEIYYDKLEALKKLENWYRSSFLFFFDK